MAVASKELVETAYKSYVEMVFRFCLWRLASHHDAEDVTTEVFVKVLSGKADSVPPELLPAWLLRVADNECKAVFKKRRRRREVDLEEAPDVGGSDSRPWLSPEICRAVQSLRPLPKQVLFLKVVEGWKFKDISAGCEISEGAAKMIFYRAVKRLAKILGPGGRYV